MLLSQMVVHNKFGGFVVWFETVKLSKLVFKFGFGVKFCYSVGLGVSKVQIVPNSFVYGITDKAKQVQIVNLTKAKPLVTVSLEFGFG
ncbi:hypothetical protein Hanom_Chr07g00587461 [Helianthus anomalus]